MFAVVRSHSVDVLLIPPPLQDPFNMVWSGADELKLAESFPGTRLDVMVPMCVCVCVRVFAHLWA